jgi:hypothetical protein
MVGPLHSALRSWLDGSGHGESVRAVTAEQVVTWIHGRLTDRRSVIHLPSLGHGDSWIRHRQSLYRGHPLALSESTQVVAEIEQANAFRQWLLQLRHPASDVSVIAASAPSRTRTCGLLLRRHKPPSAMQTCENTSHQRAKPQMAVVPERSSHHYQHGWFRHPNTRPQSAAAR